MGVEEKKIIAEPQDRIGEVCIADEVVAVIAALAATEVEGVDSMAGNITNDLVGKLGMKSLQKGVRVEVTEQHVTVDLALYIKYNYNIPEVSAKVQDRVMSAIENMTGLTSAVECGTKKTENNPALAAWVGKFVKVGKTYGLIDDVHGNKLGYIHCEGETWTGQLVDEQDCVALTNGDDLKLAQDSARGYLDYEIDSLTRRIARNYPMDSKATLNSMLAHVTNWRNRMRGV